jgi:hypothetical protein
MPTLAAWLLSMVVPLVIRGVVALGFTAVVFVGVETLVSQLVTYAQTYWSSMPANVLALASLSGIPDCLGMIMGAYLAKFAMQASIGASRYVFKPK